MSANHHYVVVEALNVFDAIDSVYQMFIEWKKMHHSLSTIGVIDTSKEDSKELIAIINKNVQDNILKNHFEEDAGKVLARLKVKGKVPSPYECKAIYYWADHEYHKGVFDLNPETFDIMNGSFRSHQFDEPGVTNDLSEERTLDHSVFIVIIDVQG